MEKNNETTQSNEGRSPDVGTSAWFAIVGSWLHIGTSRYNLDTLCQYSLDGQITIRLWFTFRQYGYECVCPPLPSGPGELMAALDAYFANGASET